MKLMSDQQLSILDEFEGKKTLPFEAKLAEYGITSLYSDGIEIFQVNLGKMCNQTCMHCHVDAGPDRKEIMTRETMQLALDALKQSQATIVDLTGGAPEMNPDFYWFVEQIKQLNKHIIVRSNLTILRTKKHQHAVQFFADNGIEVVSSLPCYTQKLTDKQRGDGVFIKSIEALLELNKVGYGVEGSGLILNLVYNPVGTSLPPDQSKLEADYKRILGEEFGIVFNQLYTITNIPISRYLEYLVQSDRYEDYMTLLVESFNLNAVQNVMCRNTISVSWDGNLHDCDFNQMLDLSLKDKSVQHLSDWDNEKLNHREIVLNNHCYGCTAGAGSSCTGALE